MTYQAVSTDVFRQRLLALTGPMAEIVATLYLPMLDDPQFKAVIREPEGAVDAPLPAGYGGYLIEGDLTLEEAIVLSRLNESGADGNMIFVVTGNLVCPRFVSEWGSVVLIGGDLTVSELMFIAREDSAHFVAGDVSIWALIGLDIWVEFEEGRRVEIEYGLGYALPRQRTTPGGGAVRPKRSEADSLMRLGLSDREAIFDLDMALYAEDVPSFR